MLHRQFVEFLPLEHQRHFVNRVGHVFFLDDRLGRHVAEHGELGAQFAVDRMLRATDQHMGLDADFAQLGHALLGRFGFQFARRLDERHQGDVDEKRVVLAHFERELADRLEKGQPLDVAGRSADLGDDHVAILELADLPDALLDLVRHMRDHLHRFAQVIAAPFLGQHRLVNLAGGQVVLAGELAEVKRS